VVVGREEQGSTHHRDIYYTAPCRTFAFNGPHHGAETTIHHPPSLPRASEDTSRVIARIRDSSCASLLHANHVSIDRDRSFVQGSFNSRKNCLDTRARALLRSMARSLRDVAYFVTLYHNCYVRRNIERNIRWRSRPFLTFCFHSRFRCYDVA